MPRTSEPGERTCIVTREARPVDALIRFVVAPDGAVVPDLRRRLPGRGAWVSADRATVATAVARHHLEKAFDGKVKVDPELADKVDELLLAAAAGALALARKAGNLVGGMAKVEAALASEPVIALVHAAEAAPDGVNQLSAKARRRFAESPLPVLRAFAGEQLDLAFGGANVIHAALLAGPAGANALARAQDLDRYRGSHHSRTAPLAALSTP